MVLGVVLIIAGIAMCVLPGPGIATIVCGVAVTCRGQRNFVGRVATHAEYKLDRTIGSFFERAKREVPKVAARVADRVGAVARRVSRAVGGVASRVSTAVAKRFGRVRVTVGPRRARARASKKGGTAAREVTAPASRRYEKAS